MEIRNDHNANSHKQDSLKKLKMQQKSELVKVIRGDPSLSAVPLQVVKFHRKVLIVRNSMTRRTTTNSKNI